DKSQIQIPQLRFPTFHKDNPKHYVPTLYGAPNLVAPNCQVPPRGGNDRSSSRQDGRREKKPFDPSDYDIDEQRDILRMLQMSTSGNKG
ncbi:unnamed protein product, partial [Ectocarpus fasciculatus]